MLPPYRPGLDIEITLLPSTTALAYPLYSISYEELLVFRKTLYELLNSSFIYTSRSDTSAPVIFIKKPRGGIRIYIDYRVFNIIIKKDGYPLPLLYNTLRDIAYIK